MNYPAPATHKSIRPLPPPRAKVLGNSRGLLSKAEARFLSPAEGALL